MAFGSGAMTNSIGEIRNADCIFVIGSNTTENHPVIALQVKAAVRQRGAKLIVADPRRIELVGFCPSLASAPAGDGRGPDQRDAPNASSPTGGKTRPLSRSERKGSKPWPIGTGIHPRSRGKDHRGSGGGQLVEAARLYATSPNSTILYAMGITQHVTGTNNVLALANLSMVAGQIGKPFSGVNPLRGQNNVQGACDMGGLPNVYPGYQRVDNEAVRRKFEKAWGVSLSPKPGLTLMEMMKGIAEGKIKALFIMGENPILTDPNANQGEGGAAAPGSAGGRRISSCPRPRSWPTWSFRG